MLTMSESITRVVKRGLEALAADGAVELLMSGDVTGCSLRLWNKPISWMFLLKLPAVKFSAVFLRPCPIVNGASTHLSELWFQALWKYDCVDLHSLLLEKFSFKTMGLFLVGNEGKNPKLKAVEDNPKCTLSLSAPLPPGKAVEV